MTSICMYFQVHQPYRIRPDYHFFDIGTGKSFSDDGLNKMVIERVAEKCYLPANKTLLNQIKKHGERFRVSFSISGIALEQFETFAPEVIDSFRALVDTGQVELLNETYYHSLACVFSDAEFVAQVNMHREKVEALFGVTPKTFRNTELIYNSTIAKRIEKLGFTSMIAEGTETLLGWRSPNYVYMPDTCFKLNLLLRNYKLSDDLAFRFNQSDWNEYPLTPAKYATWLHRHGMNSDIINLCMDYETFGEHQDAKTGILAFMDTLAEEVFREESFEFITPCQVRDRHEPVFKLKAESTSSWADQERDLSAWLGNNLQDSSAELVYGLEQEVKASGDEEVLRDWRRLLSSDHFYYMAKKSCTDGEVHSYFSPFATPYDAFITYTNALNDISFRVKGKQIDPVANLVMPMRQD